MTFPAGFYLQHREYQYGWAYALAGAAMPAIYCIAATIDNSTSTNNGTASFLFGTWLWAVLLLVARPSTAACALPWQPIFKLLSILAAVMVGGFAIASVFYGTIERCDADAALISLFGLWACTVGMGGLLACSCRQQWWNQRCGRHTHTITAAMTKGNLKQKPGLPMNSNANINGDDGVVFGGGGDRRGGVRVANGNQNHSMHGGVEWQSFADHNNTTFGPRTPYGVNGSIFGSRPSFREFDASFHDGYGACVSA
jgi:hypothetical protein